MTTRPAPTPSRTSFLAFTATLLALLVAAGCSDSSTDNGDDEFQLQGIIQSLSAENASVSTRTGSPAEDAAAPQPVVSGGNSIIPGGGSGYTISANADFSVLYVSVEGLEGYYEVDFNSLRSQAEVVLTYAGDIEDEDVTFQFAVGTGEGAGASAARNVQVVPVGTGDVQVSVSWDVASDVDLYVVEPSGDEIYYGDRTSDSGGELDLDSNAACAGQDVRNENITWPDDPAPRGEYQVRVNYWSACSQPRTAWVVTVQVAGQPVRTYTGVFTGSGEGGGSGAGQLVTTFTY